MFNFKTIIPNERFIQKMLSSGKPAIVMKPIKGGALTQAPEKTANLFETQKTGRSPAFWAIRFTASHEGIMTVPSSMSFLLMMCNLSYVKDFDPKAIVEFNVSAQAGETPQKALYRDLATNFFYSWLFTLYPKSHFITLFACYFIIV